MALGTNYRRNVSREDKTIGSNLRRAVALSEQFVKDYGLEFSEALDLSAGVVLGRITMEQVQDKYGRKS